MAAFLPLTCSLTTRETCTVREKLAELPANEWCSRLHPDGGHEGNRESDVKEALWFMRFVRGPRLH